MHWTYPPHTHTHKQTSVQNIGLGSEVIKFDASDEDSSLNGAVNFRLVNVGGVNSPFLLNSISGSLSVIQPLDRETTPQYTVSSCTHVLFGIDHAYGDWLSEGRSGITRVLFTSELYTLS